MTSTLKDSISQLKKITPRLNQVTDEANALVARVEDFLNNKVSVGLSAWVKVSSETASCSTEPDEAHDTESAETVWLTTTLLGYTRIAGKFRIAVRHDDECYVDGVLVHSELCEEMPWASCPREVKLSTLARLPALLQAIAMEAIVAVDKTQAASDAVRQVLAALEDDDEAAAPALGRDKKLLDDAAKSKRTLDLLRVDVPKTVAPKKLRLK